MISKFHVLAFMDVINLVSVILRKKCQSYKNTTIFSKFNLVQFWSVWLQMFCIKNNICIEECRPIYVHLYEHLNSFHCDFYNERKDQKISNKACT